MTLLDFLLSSEPLEQATVLVQAGQNSMSGSLHLNIYVHSQWLVEQSLKNRDTVSDIVILVIRRT